MRLPTLFLALIILITIQAQGQPDAKVLQDARLIQKEVQKVFGYKTISTTCIAPIKQYGSNLAAITINNQAGATVNKYIYINQNFIKLTAEKSFADNCKSKAITQLIADVQTWTKALQQYQYKVQFDTIRLDVLVTDTASKRLFISNIQADSVSGLKYFITKDSSGYAGIAVIVPHSADTITAVHVSKKRLTGTYIIDINTPAQQPHESSKGNFIHGHWLLFVLLLAWGIIGTVAVIYLYKALNQLKSKAKAIASTGLVIPKNNLIPEYNQQQATKVEQNEADINHNSPIAERYFDCEMLMTAGPRKKPMDGQMMDVDLGEDVCGFALRNDEALLWLLDGTSDKDDIRNPANHELYFSSRLLAQSIAGQLKAAIELTIAKPINELIADVSEQVKLNWLSYINALPNSEKLILAQAVKQAKFLECATTVLIARLQLSGSLTVYRSGDSKMFLYVEEDEILKLLPSTLDKKNESSNDRVFFRLLLNEDATFNIVFNQPQFELVEQQNIQTVIACSDGVGKITEHALRNNYATNSEAVRAEVGYQAQATADDKTLCILNIREVVSA